MIVFAAEQEVTSSLCFTVPLLIPCFAVLFYVFQRIFRGPIVLPPPPDVSQDDGMDSATTQDGEA